MRISDLTWTAGNSTVLNSNGYVWNAANELTFQADNNGLAGTRTYTHDGISRLKTSTPSGSLFSGESARTWNYDAAGNRTSVVTTGSPRVTYTPKAGEWNLYGTVGGVSMAYDANKNLTSDGVLAMLYDADNRLTDISKSGLSEELTYDWMGRIIKKTVTVGSTAATTRYYYSGWTVLAEVNESTGTTGHRYVHGPAVDELLADETGGTTYHVLKDLGSTTALITGPGSNTIVTQRYTYDPCGTPTVRDAAGNPLPSGTAPTTKYLFTGREYDHLSGLYSYRHRFYHPGLGRFQFNRTHGSSGSTAGTAGISPASVPGTAGSNFEFYAGINRSSKPGLAWDHYPALIPNSGGSFPVSTFPPLDIDGEVRGNPMANPRDPGCDERKDSNNDGIPDWYADLIANLSLRHGITSATVLSPGFRLRGAGGPTIIEAEAPPALDTDGDGLSDIDEGTLGSNPNVRDTDGDGLDDGDELTLGIDPTKRDTDGDYCSDGEEIQSGTDPNSKRSAPTALISMARQLWTPIEWFTTHGPDLSAHYWHDFYFFMENESGNYPYALIPIPGQVDDTHVDITGLPNFASISPLLTGAVAFPPSAPAWFLHQARPAEESPFAGSWAGVEWEAGADINHRRIWARGAAPEDSELIVAVGSANF